VLETSLERQGRWQRLEDDVGSTFLNFCVRSNGQSAETVRLCLRFGSLAAAAKSGSQRGFLKHGT
jgi:hypothetical protein